MASFFMSKNERIEFKGIEMAFETLKDLMACDESERANLGLILHSCLARASIEREALLARLDIARELEARELTN